MSVVEDSLRTIADDLALSQKLDLEVLDLVKRVDALEARAATPSVPTTAPNAWGELAIRVVRVFLFTGISTFVTLITGLGAFPDMATAKSIAWSAIVAGMAAILKVVQAAFTAGEAPFFGRGIGTKPTP